MTTTGNSDPRKCWECGSFKETDERDGYDGVCCIEDEFDHDPEHVVKPEPCNGCDKACCCFWDPYEQPYQFQQWAGEDR